MPGWQSSNRRNELPPDWQAIRKRILRRDDNACQWVIEGHGPCLRPANEVDHRQRGSDHSDANLRALCSWHHQRKSSSEGAAVTAAQRRVIKRKFRRDERHPGSM